MTAHRVRHHLGLVSAWIVEARGVNGEELRHGREGQIDRRPAGGAEAARLHAPAVADHVPMRRFALELHRLPAREGQIGSVPGAARTLAVAALAVVYRNRRGRDFIADRAAGASAGVRLAHVSLPIKRCIGHGDFRRVSPSRRR